MESLSGNYTSLLNEYQQKTQFTVDYEEGHTDGPSHNKRFTMRAIVNGQRFPDGTGKTKKEAKQNAAKNALEGLKSTHSVDPTPSPVENISINSITSHRNYTCWLNEYSQKNRFMFKACESTKMDPGNLNRLCTYVCKYVCDDKEFPEGYGKNKKEAKEAAAFCVHEELHKTQNAEVMDENSNRAQRSETTSYRFCGRSPSLDRHSSFADDSRSSTPDNNYIAYLNNYCQKNKHVYDFKLVDRRGPPHNPEFVYKVVMDGKEYLEAPGRSAKEAKQNAAQHALSEIRDQSGWATPSSEDGASSQTQDTCKSEDVQRPANASSSSDFISFRDSVAVSSPMDTKPSVSPLDLKPKIKLAPRFLSPNGLDRSKEGGPDMKVLNPAKASGGQTSNSAAKSRFLEDFDSINPIGKGGFGRVFKARRKLENKYYAVKIVKSTEKARREVGALADFNNPNIVRYFSSWEEDTAYKHESSESFSDFSSGSGPGTMFLYIHMEFCEGNTLRVWIKERNSQNKHFPERRTEAAQICWQVLKAVEYIHSKSLIHRDLKPPNIMFSSEGRVKVGDFGLVTVEENENDEQLLERTKRTGTRTYMSPEQMSQTSYDRKVDIYALGLVYFELIWNLGTVHEKEKIWDKLRMRTFPQQFTKMFMFEYKLMERMLSPRPEDRPDAAELVLDLDQHYTHLKTAQDLRTV